MFCKYYQATATRDKIWMVTGTCRSENNWVFDRTLDAPNNLMEFFVAPDYEQEFVYLMQLLQKEGIIWEFKALPNRCQIEGKL
ncbi:TPA: hypothetical protein DEO28_01230 [Candidatus Dependentiae bacterium]|nr:MAG: hypothetical protein UR14_C0003G0096 [candidate division TM6 bacterium GW2011_GWE2_31_21]KKP53740.1 MAG: hypothetical protein UR43_C0003G0061 [candidate division TM6 bacterium GW2011_GWF2_33_332]HBS48506.1 hypothetical protein [Candidatus Dependentiae bacterium]HBZ73121.1 hypothetical protein [Candidatus Dependentiae bacterium]